MIKIRNKVGKETAAVEAKSHKAKPERKSGRYQFLSGRIFAGLLVPEPKTSLNQSKPPWR